MTVSKHDFRRWERENDRESLVKAMRTVRVQEEHIFNSAKANAIKWALEMSKTNEFKKFSELLHAATVERMFAIGSTFPPDKASFVQDDKFVFVLGHDITDAEGELLQAMSMFVGHVISLAKLGLQVINRELNEDSMSIVEDWAASGTDWDTLKQLLAKAAGVSNE